MTFSACRSNSRNSFQDGSAREAREPLPIFGGGGIVELDAFVPVTVVAYLSTKGGGHGERERVDHSRPRVTVGGGVRLALSKRVAAMVSARFQAAFGGTAGFLPGAVPELGSRRISVRAIEPPSGTLE